MALTDVEASRIADAIAAVRPDWPARSLRHFVAGRLRDRAFADALVALAVVAADPASETPARVLEPGPWWTATRANRPGDATYTPGPGHDEPCRRPGHEHERAAACRACRAEQLAGPCCDLHNANCHDIEEICCHGCPGWPGSISNPARPVPAPADWRTR